MISNDILQRIDDETDIVALVSEFVSLEKKGKNFMGLCPFHDEKTPSFSVSTEKNIAMCMGCGGGGRPINFLRQIKNISLAEAANELAKRVGIDLNIKIDKKEVKNKELYDLMEEAKKFFQVNLFNSVSGQDVLKYLENRKLESDTISHFKLGYASRDKDQLYQFLSAKGYSVSNMIDLGLVKQSQDGSYYDLFNDRLMFPITNSFGKVVGFSGRTLNKNENIKYVNSPETVIFKKGDIIYNLFESSLDIRRKKQVILYEGFFDVISAHQAGSTNGIATMGTALTTNQANLIKRTIDNIVIAYDGDNAGIKATISAIPVLLRAKLLVEALQIPDKMDPDDFIGKFGKDKYLELLNTNIVDPYTYQFDYYLSITNLNDANDITVFQKNVSRMLQTAKPAVVSLYKNKLAKVLNIDITDINIKITKPTFDGGYVPQEPGYNPEDNFIPPYDNEFLPEKNETTKSLGSKYLNADKRLIILMIRSKEWHDELSIQLSNQDYSNTILFMIRLKLGYYYENNELFDMVEFFKTLKEDEIEFFETEIITDEYWKNQTKLNKIEIDNYIHLLKGTKLERRIKYLLEQIVEKEMKGQSFVRDNEEYLKLKKEQEQLMEDLINNG